MAAGIAHKWCIRGELHHDVLLLAISTLLHTTRFKFFQEPVGQVRYKTEVRHMLSVFDST